MVITACSGASNRRALASEVLAVKLGSPFLARSANDLTSLRLTFLTCKTGSITVPTCMGWGGPWEVHVQCLGGVQYVLAATPVN